MRLHISLEDEIVRELDQRVGPRRRSAFITAAVRRALDDARRWDLIESSLGGIDAQRHAWDADPAAWVHTERHADERRVG